MSKEEPETIDLTKEENADTAREVLVLDAEQPDGRGHREPASASNLTPQSRVPLFSTRRRREQDASSTGVYRIQLHLS